ncbi:MAG: AAA family ATPase, partial [Burkholderiaceae bacterium]|nr:AAA family ATPase [Burkholderiaceae bacterium]
SPTEGNENRRVLARSKSNIGPDEGGFEYHIDQAEPIRGIQASYIAWGESVAGTARELLAEPEHDQGDAGEKQNAVDEATKFLVQVLDGGHTPTATIQAEAKGAGVSWASVRRAGDSLKVIKQKGMGGIWYWKLPECNQLAQKTGQVAQDAQLSNGEQVEQVDEQPEQVEPESEVS